MPCYEFECPKCHYVVELKLSMDDETLPLCCGDDCNAIEMKRIISKTGFQLKGNGWAADGYSKAGVK